MPKPRRTPITEPSANDEKLSDHDPRNVFASDGRKLEESAFVGSPAPDTDAEPDDEPVILRVTGAHAVRLG